MCETLVGWKLLPTVPVCPGPVPPRLPTVCVLSSFKQPTVQQPRQHPVSPR